MPQQDRGDVGVGNLAGSVGDQREGLVLPDIPEECRGDLGGSLQPALPSRRLLVEPGVLDDDARGGRERDDDLLVVRGEAVPGLLLGQVEVAEDGVPDADGHAEERVHRRVVGGETVGLHVLAERGQSKRLRRVDDHAEDAVTAREVADLRALHVGEPVRDELPQPPVRAGAEHAEGAVLRIRELASHPDDALQDAVHVEVGGDADHRVQQPAQPVLGVSRRRPTSGAEAGRRDARGQGRDGGGGAEALVFHAITSPRRSMPDPHHRDRRAPVGSTFRSRRSTTSAAPSRRAG